MDLLSAYPELQRWDFRILATDVDTSVLAKAQSGVYPDSELTGIPESRVGLLERTGKTVTVPETARKAVSFKPLNLIAEWPMRGPFDAVFCRNVTIYFDKRTQARVFSRLGTIIAPGGFLYIGHSENLGSGNEAFRLVGKTVYQVTDKAAEARSAA
jgi:chemotaxis protein methyltransferase CheR